ncbi:MULTISPECIES: glycosyltransferase [Flavobacteriaceae]|uniref:glycosyltransferase n=1 Tax=Flavobacteriaceae TaxID=49546 RepID=UPI003A92E230
MDNFLVSICCITYNHQKFIEQCLEGILNQKTTFPIEIIIGEDESSDDTREVCLQYAKKYPSKIKLFLRFRKDVIYINGAPTGRYNFIESLKECTGKYIALCEGDDYWTDPLKLQKQVDFLEANPDYEVCFTNIRIANANDVITKEALITDNRKTDYIKKDLPIWAPTLTRVFRNRDFSSLPSAPGLDTVMLLWQSQFGRIKFLNEVTGTYRVHEGGIYSSHSEAKRKEQILLTNLACLNLIETSLYSKYFGLIFKKLLELKSLNKEIYTKNKKRIQEHYNIRKTDFSFSLQLKMTLAFFLISLPISNKNDRLQQLFMKVLNRFFIY